MAFKLEIVQQSFKITNTDNSEILLDLPKSSIYYDADAFDNGIVDFMSVRDSEFINNKLRQLPEFSIANTVDSGDNPFTSTTLELFIQTNLGFNTASGGSGAVDSVNGKTGVVILNAADVGAVSALEQDQVIYVSKIGNNANNGLSPNTPKLTIGNAITTANALTPSITNQIAIEVIDGAEYNENFTLSSFVHLFAFKSAINGKIFINDSCIIRARRLHNTDNNADIINKTSGTGSATVETIVMDVSGAAQAGVKCTSGDINFECEQIIVDAGRGIEAKNGAEIAFSVAEVILTNGGLGIGTRTGTGTASRISGKIIRVRELTADCVAIETKQAGDLINIQGGVIRATTFYDIGANAELSAFVNIGEGNRIANASAVVNVINLKGNSQLNGTVVANAFIGDGSRLTNLPGGGGASNPKIYVVDDATDLSGDLSAHAGKIFSVQAVDIDMAAASITLPLGVYVRNDGGSIINGTIDLNGGEIDPELLDYRLTLSNGTLKHRTYRFNKIKAGIVEATTDSTITENNKHRWNHIIEQVNSLKGNHVVVDSLDATYSVFSQDNRGVDQWSRNESLKLYGGITYEFSDDTYFRVRADNAWGSALFNTSRQDNITVIGGNLIGDRANHNYDVPVTDPTRVSHEFGCLLNIVGSHNFTIIGTNIQQATADGIIIDGTSIRNPDGTVQVGERESKNLIIKGCTIEYARRNNISVLDGVMVRFENNDIGYAAMGYSFAADGSIGAWGRLPGANVDLEAYQQTNPNNPGQSLRFEDSYLVEFVNNRFYGAWKADLYTFKCWRVLVDNNSFTNTINNQYAYDNTFRDNTLTWDESLRQGKLVNDNFTAVGSETTRVLPTTAMPSTSYYEDFYITIDGTPIIEGVDYTVTPDRTTVNFTAALTASQAVVINYWEEQTTRNIGIGVNNALTINAGGNFSQVSNIMMDGNSVIGYDIGISLNGSGTKAKNNYIYNFTYAGLSGASTYNNVFEDNDVISNVEGVYGIEFQNGNLEAVYRNNLFKIPNGSFCFLDGVNEGIPTGGLIVTLAEIGDTLDTLTVDGVSIISGSVAATTTNETTTAGQIVSAINTHTSVPNYTATNSGTTIKITHEDSANDGGEYFEVVATFTGMTGFTADFIKSPKNNIIEISGNTIECRDAGELRDIYGLWFKHNKTNVGFSGYDIFRSRFVNNMSVRPLSHSFIGTLYHFADNMVKNNIIEVVGDETIHVNGIDNRGSERNEIVNNIFTQTGNYDVIKLQRGIEENIDNIIANNRIENGGTQQSIDVVGTNNVLQDNYSYSGDITTAGSGFLIKYTKPNTACPTYADNATALAALGAGYYYKLTGTGEFKITY